ncbi:mechanosensitive ion channel [Stieleria sp. TO1_6]|uniref:mechanosensitive ion channel family protein n=1 Tax=Stieleria tagensis TaxID=2956795 RepID=UPI00209ADB41|nr:mechanosensitive ion channel domain-containing protein [Stieleria tagensis]MCO8121873.1 mechanosensitive ion channel [Stieleria tagensis]
MLVADAGVSTAPTGPSSDLAPTDNGAVGQMMNGEFEIAEMVAFFEKSIAPNLLNACLGLTVVFVGYFVAKYVSRIVARPIRHRIDETFGRFIGTTIFYSIMLSVIAAVASKLGAPLGGLAAVLAAAGFAIGLAFQGTLSNFAAGMLMIVFRPFKVGDMVNIAGVAGKVNEIDLFTTTLDTPDNRRLIIPNSSISGGTIENISFHPHRRVEVIVGVEYDANIDATRQALQSAADVFVRETIHGDGRGTAIVLSGLGDSAVEWKVRMWVQTSDYWPMTEALTAEVKRQLDRVGISIPYPQMDVHLMQSEPAAASEPTIRPRIRPARRDTSRDNNTGGLPQSLPYAS